MLNFTRSKDLYEKGRLSMEAENFEDAVALFTESIQTAPHFKTLELLGECFLLMELPSSAIPPLAAATALNNQVRAPAMLAEAFLALGEPDEARRFAEIVLTRDPKNKRAKRVMEKID